ncbi:hypothetical protein ABBQ32_008633 [Trebouxia sp. C0010 RCD-2024]
MTVALSRPCRLLTISHVIATAGHHFQVDTAHFVNVNLETPAFSDVSVPVIERAHSFQALLSNFRGKVNRSSVPPWPNKLKLGDFGMGSLWLNDLVLGSVALEKT